MHTKYSSKAPCTAVQRARQHTTHACVRAGRRHARYARERTLLSSGAADGSGAALRTCCAAHPVLFARTRSVGSSSSPWLSHAGAPKLSKVTADSNASAASTAAATAATSRSDADSRSEGGPPSLIAPQRRQRAEEGRVGRVDCSATVLPVQLAHGRSPSEPAPSPRRGVGLLRWLRYEYASESARQRRRPREPGWRGAQTACASPPVGVFPGRRPGAPASRHA